MDNLRLYRVQDKYVRFLKGVDKKVQDNKNRRRPYVGVVLYVSDFRYFVPLESPKEGHAKLKAGRHILKIDDGKMGLLGFNNMIPIHDEALISFDINDENDKKYAELLRRQVSWLNRNKSDVLFHASKTYYAATKGNNSFLNSICCDFKNLKKPAKNIIQIITRR